MKLNLLNQFYQGQAPVAHTYKPSYSGDGDQEDGSSRPAWGKKKKKKKKARPYPNTWAGMAE
jgi:hypothetical protein